MGKLSRLESVDLRDIWKTEAGDFTPWLAQEENLGLLGDAIGIELELEAQEKSVGPFRADILCKDTGTGNWVLIENQLERTDHSHLGQLLTYAAGLKAVTIVWIADRFSEEHRAALDWLNEITDSRFNFFGLGIELWKIDNSPVAPKFNMVCKPNDWSRTISGAAKRIDETGLTETQLLQLDYWGALREHILREKSSVKPQKPAGQCWTNFALGKTNVQLHAAVNSIKKIIAVGVSLYGDEAKAHFHLLHEDKENIEKELGFQMEWEELPNGKESRIVLRKHGVDFSVQKEWPEQHDWMLQRLEVLHRVFSARARQLNAADYQDNDG